MEQKPMEVNLYMGKQPEQPQRDYLTPILLMVLMLGLAGFGIWWIAGRPQPTPETAKPPAQLESRLQHLEANQGEIIKRLNMVMTELNPQTTGTLVWSQAQVDRQIVARLQAVEKAYGDMLRLLVVGKKDKPTTGGQ